MARLHNDMTRLHHRIRRSGWPWPTQTAFDAHFLRRNFLASSDCYSRAILGH